ncbi:hypothetical protein AAFF_G00030010 [Aldrovandia affinis]|uniref:Uncharacterized protein n=1 Tax=Aldrovandia affinis TaxID=143900 RepID=A0AAD7S4D3_9TELE|nr:hypothetical protein AAFF_G00030010 [Aldrovandia affinis]
MGPDPSGAAGKKLGRFGRVIQTPRQFCCHILAGIAPASLRQDAATLALARKAQKYDWHILHKATTRPAPPCRLKSRHPYNKAAQEMLQSIPEDLSRDAWLAASWKQTWETAGPSRILRYIRDPGDGVRYTRSSVVAMGLSNLWEPVKLQELVPLYVITGAKTQYPSDET